jgi:hypothetical protein
MEEDKYAVIMETNGELCESWLYFVKYQGNEEALEQLSDDINRIDTPTLMEDANAFDIDICKFVSKQTAAEMIMLELNSATYHRRFDGTMTKIDFGFSTKKRYTDERIVEKIDKLIGGGRISDFVTDEFVPESHMNPDQDSDIDLSDVSSVSSDVSSTPSDVSSASSSGSVDLDITDRLKI